MACHFQQIGKLSHPSPGFGRPPLFFICKIDIRALSQWSFNRTFGKNSCLPIWLKIKYMEVQTMVHHPPKQNSLILNILKFTGFESRRIIHKKYEGQSFSQKRRLYTNSGNYFRFSFDKRIIQQ